MYTTYFTLSPSWFVGPVDGWLGVAGDAIVDSVGWEAEWLDSVLQASAYGKAFSDYVTNVLGNGTKTSASVIVTSLNGTDVCAWEALTDDLVICSDDIGTLTNDSETYADVYLTFTSAFVIEANNSWGKFDVFVMKRENRGRSA